MASTSLRAELAPRIAPVVLANITTRYPYHDSRLFREGDASFDAFAAHPAFGNSFDWHSSVHSHWTALQLLEFSGSGEAEIDRVMVSRLREAVKHNLTSETIETEARFLADQPTYERPYGWAWLLRFVSAANSSGHVGQVGPALREIADQVGGRAFRWLDVMPGPVRHGVHSNTAFAMGLMLDASRALHLEELERAIVAKAAQWFAPDRDYPASWERSAHDFLSPGLTVADLMRRVTGEETFIDWWRAFAPSVEQRAALVAVADVPNVQDGQIVHLHGLNLSRAGVLARLAAIGALGPLLDPARKLYSASVDAAYGHDYLSTHWLPTFAWDAAASIDAARSG